MLFFQVFRKRVHRFETENCKKSTEKAVLSYECRCVASDQIGFELKVAKLTGEGSVIVVPIGDVVTECRWAARHLLTLTALVFEHMRPTVL